MIFRYLRMVIIKDMDSGEEKEVVEYTTSMNHIKDGMVFIARTGTGKLLVGMNLDPRLEIYDLSGKRINSIALDIDPLKVTDQIRANYQMSYIVRKNGVPHKGKAPIGKILPYYSDLSVDSQGNILVFLMTENIKEGPYPFQVYSPEGELICRAELDTAEFAFKPDPRYDKFDFTDKGIFCILHRQGDEMETPLLMKIPIK